MLRFLSAVITNSPLGTVRATTSKPYFVEGELVQGNVHCEFLAPVAAKSITVVLEGYEKVEWHERKDRTETIPGTDPPQSRTIPRYVRRRAKKTFFKQNIPVHLIQGSGMMPGTYDFPFSYALPAQLPGSFYERQPLTDIPHGCEFEDKESGFFSKLKGEAEKFEDSDDEDGGTRRKLLAVINYKLKVTVDLVNFGGFIPDLYTRIPLIVHPHLGVPPQPIYHEESREVVVCCCFKKGPLHVAARFDKNAYVAGETADVHADLDNQSTKVLPTQVQLHRVFTIKTNDGSADFSEDILAVDYPPLQAKTKLRDEPLPLKLVGDKVKPTTSGNFISCRYMYQFHCGVSWGSDIEFSVPLTIYMPQPPPMPLTFAAAPMPGMAAAAAAPMMPVQPMIMSPSGGAPVVVLPGQPIMVAAAPMLAPQPVVYVQA